jgi:SpoVK/Ycf46/Vps4 family AAA+-type ATPase
MAPPTILFLDDVDALFGVRSGDGGDTWDTSTHLLSTLLTEMDGLELTTGTAYQSTFNRARANAFLWRYSHRSFNIFELETSSWICPLLFCSQGTRRC